MSTISSNGSGKHNSESFQKEPKMNSIKVAFMGRLGSDPELRTSQAGKPWAALAVAVGDGDEVQWVRVAVFGEKAEQVAGSVHKGERVYCEGTLKLNTWTDREGQQRAGLSVAAWRCQPIGQIGQRKPQKPRNGGQAPAPETPEAGEGRQRAPAPRSQTWPDDPIPF